MGCVKTGAGMLADLRGLSIGGLPTYTICCVGDCGPFLAPLIRCAAPELVNKVDLGAASRARRRLAARPGQDTLGGGACFCCLRLSPFSSMRWALWARRSSTATAMVGLPMIPYQASTGSWLVTIVDRDS